jgi:hypothetical protein
MTGANMSRVMVAAIGVVGLVLAILLAYHLKPSPMSPEPEITVPRDSQPLDQTETEETAPGEGISLGSLLGENKPAPPPIAFRVGPRPGEDDTTDLSSPAIAVHSVLSLIDQGRSDRLPSCFIDESEDIGNMLYPRYLGQPIELVEVLEEDDAAEVIWNGTVHTAFSLAGQNRSPGETVTLRTKLVWKDDLWKLLKLHEGGKDGHQ